MINLLRGPGVLLIKITDTDDKSSPWTRRADDKYSPWTRRADDKYSPWTSRADDKSALLIRRTDDNFLLETTAAPQIRRDSQS